MTDGKSHTFEKIAALVASIETSGDDAFAMKHLRIAELYVAIGDRANAVSWFLRAARHSEMSDHGMYSVMWSRRAIEIAPEDAEARDAHAEFARRYEIPKGETPFVLPASFFTPRRK